VVVALLNNPYIIVKINVAMGIYIVVGINVGHIIIIGMIVTYRAPFRLIAYIYTNTKANLGICHFK
jgi:hypothetical protein